MVDRARIAFEEVVANTEHDALRAGLKTAKGVLIFPSIIKGGFIVGASGGTGVSSCADPATARQRRMDVMPSHGHSTTSRATK
jgi:lipid-binding SYLF domain-containing protein